MKLNSFDEVFSNEFRDPEFVKEYLEAALEENGIQSFLVALQNVIRATEGMTKTAEIAGVGRESLYKSLSESGNPQIATIDKILRQIGLRFSVTTLTIDSQEIRVSNT
ncbi:addiction module antidote protein [Stanieria cyanosphaera PCC 7437]|uniref:Addiction module antidote protein n=1 Tax=Stanieria cyanosphaera (strain ATCC 29371 / PCC 7437) TaxID=111780 RepID=K9XP73_STAC7|nr:addiction module antidote protein [Stanieria cyanosphaera]AFZ33846.1 addiction module antidote protein [Stanieria cyanosphaera PCC 7437]